MKKLQLLVIVLAVGLSTWGIAQAATGGNHTNKPTSGPAPQSVAKTPAGMPPTSQVTYAVVNADGTLARGFPRGTNGVASSRIALGAYQVDFKRDVSGWRLHGDAR